MTGSPAHAAEPLRAHTEQVLALAERAVARLLDNKGVKYSLPDQWLQWLPPARDLREVYVATGADKTHAAASLMLRAGRIVANFSTTLDQQASRRLRRHLLTSVEDETGLPSITALITGDSSTATFGSGAPLSQQQAAEAAEAWRAVYRIARDVVERSICVQHYAFEHHPPPLETSPCGVIGFAAPRIPRAPGRPVYSPVQSSLGVAA